jgi:lipid A 3-O-deacylase
VKTLALGLSAKFGDAVFIRPGLGIAVHTGSAKNFQDTSNDETEFGSRILFEPELGIGARINDRTTIEASWVHMSHAQLFGKQNPGMDNLGMRLTIQLP